MSPAPWKGPEKVAALLSSLDPEMAANLLSQMNEEEIAAIGTAMATMDPVNLTEENIGSLHQEFVSAMIADNPAAADAGGLNLPPINQILEEMLGRALPPDKARQIRTKIESAAKKSRPFLGLEKLRLDMLKKVLAGEHPQVVALVCAKMSPDSTAAVLGGMEEAERNDVIRRMATMLNPKPDLLREVISSLEAKASSFKAPTAEAGGEAVEEEAPHDPVKVMKGVAEVLKTVDPEVEKSILKDLDEKDAELAKQIRELMFTFEDLGTLDKKAMQKVLMGFDVRIIALALKAADPAVEANFIANMSKRVQGMLAEERETIEAASVEEVQGAQKEIMTTVRAMIEQGEIQIPRKGNAKTK